MKPHTSGIEHALTCQGLGFWCLPHFHDITVVAPLGNSLVGNKFFLLGGGGELPL